MTDVYIYFKEKLLWSGTFKSNVFALPSLENDMFIVSKKVFKDKGGGMHSQVYRLADTHRITGSELSKQFRESQGGTVTTLRFMMSPGAFTFGYDSKGITFMVILVSEAKEIENIDKASKDIFELIVGESGFFDELHIIYEKIKDVKEDIYKEHIKNINKGLSKKSIDKIGKLLKNCSLA